MQTFRALKDINQHNFQDGKIAAFFNKNAVQLWLDVGESILTHQDNTYTYVCDKL